MADSSILTDAYLADLLAKDAKDASIKYSALGLQGYASTSKSVLCTPLRTSLTPFRPPVNKPKPNTRFLRNIIESTDSHNAALRAKEAAESRARLEDLRKNEDGTRRPSNLGSRDIRRRQLGDIEAILGGRRGKETDRKRRKVASGESKGRRVNTSSEDEDDQRERRSRQTERHRGREVEADNKGKDHRKDRHRRRRGEERDEEREGGRARHEDRKRRRRSHSSDDKEHDAKKRRRGSTRSPEPSKNRDSQHCRARSPTSPHTKTHRSSKHKKSTPASSDSDSDPLDSIIGPRPAPPPATIRPRGRGASALLSTNGLSGIDARFSSSYDPNMDSSLPDSSTNINGSKREEDWDLALEALRDRRIWMKKGAERLRAAGWGEDEVGRWERLGFGTKKDGEREKGESDLKWKKRGEAREWDIGKEMGGDEDLDLEVGEGRTTRKAEWGRLKGT